MNKSSKIERVRKIKRERKKGEESHQKHLPPQISRVYPPKMSGKEAGEADFASAAVFVN